VPVPQGSGDKMIKIIAALQDLNLLRLLEKDKKQQQQNALLCSGDHTPKYL
jgi:hypothetical protein